MKDNMQEGFHPVDEGDEVAPQLREALAAYFERANGGDLEADPLEIVSSGQPELVKEWRELEALLEAPRKAVPTLDVAWARFQSRAFDVAPATEPASLGIYVAENEQVALKESGLSPATLAAFKSDSTPLEELKGYQLNDYVALARRYGVKDSAFPRLLNWLKGLAKGFSAPSYGSSRGMVFARDEEARRQGLNEAEVARQLEGQQQNAPGKAEETEE